MGQNSVKKQRVIGLTGGIGSGKSAVAAYLKASGYPVINADELSREVTSPGTQALDEIVAVFGSAALDSVGSLNRSWLRERIFADPAKRKKLEAILHPKIRKLALQKTAELTQKGASVVFYEAPLLIEAGSTDNLDAIICVTADDDLRVKRVAARDGVTGEQVRAAIAAQMPQAEKAARCSHIITNNGDLDQLRANTDAVLAELGV